MQNIISRITKYYKNRRDYFFSPVLPVFDYGSHTSLSKTREKRILDELDPADYHHNLILTTYFCSKPDPQRKIVIDNDNFQYIKDFYDSVVEHDLHAVIFYDNLSNEFITKYTCPNVKFVKTKIIRYSLNDERYFIYAEFLAKVKAGKIIMSDGNDVTFGSDPFDFIANSRFYIGRDHHVFNKHSEWIQNKVNILPEPIRRKVPPLFYEMPLLSAGVIGGDYATITSFLDKVVTLLHFIDNDLNNNMAVVNIVFFDSYWIGYNKNLVNKLKFLRTKDRKKLVVKPTIQNDSFHIGKPFTSHYWKFEKNNGSYVYHK